ncbi:Protein bric-a-brac 2 [Nymphon striatum]|nr:Protein bric-a-brac 2 [Nymphon striatum]
MGANQFCLKWNDYQSNFTTAFSNLFANNDMVDATLVCEGETIRVHKLILSACSSFFQSIFKENPCQHPVVILKDMKYSELKAVLEFIYKGEISILQDQLPGILKTADYLKINGLSNFNANKETDRENDGNTKLNNFNGFRHHSPVSGKKDLQHFRSSTGVNNSEKLISSRMQENCEQLENSQNFCSPFDQEDIKESKPHKSKMKFKTKHISHSRVAEAVAHQYESHFMKTLVSSSVPTIKNIEGTQDFSKSITDLPMLIRQNSFDSSVSSSDFFALFFSPDLTFIKYFHQQDSFMDESSQTLNNETHNERTSSQFIKSDFLNHSSPDEEIIDVDDISTERNVKFTESSENDLNKISASNLNTSLEPNMINPNILKSNGNISAEGNMCPVCGNTFSTNGSMKRHLQSVHLNYRIPCPICGSLFTQKPSMERHMELVHFLSKSQLKLEIASLKSQ